ncbi:hypothetical protein GCM10009613_30680 [Pseudonocardia kongjuensis]|uniref:Uncharacterized protein n=1 Tax=Pseudonocardia kongjuensis TaxID=102227 RepID=A0ABP4ILA7_9PSEU
MTTASDGSDGASYLPDGGPRTWGDGELGENDVIEARDGTGFLSRSDFVQGEPGLAPDLADDAD